MGNPGFQAGTSSCSFRGKTEVRLISDPDSFLCFKKDKIVLIKGFSRVIALMLEMGIHELSLKRRVSFTIFI